MKYILLFSTIVIILNTCSCQTKYDSFGKSRKVEIEGWKLLFSEKFDSAKTKFSDAIEICDTNYRVFLGFAALKGVNGDANYFIEISKACKSNDDLLWTYGHLCAIIVDYFNEPLDKRDTTNKSYNEVKAMLTDGKYIERVDNGRVYLEGQYKNGKRSGVWNYIDTENKVFKSITYSDTNNICTYKFYKPNGDIISEDTWTSEEGNAGSSTKLKEVIYWQEVPGKTKEYLFVSKIGFCIYEKGKSNVLDSNTPDNVIEMSFDKDYFPIWYIWKNGKKEIYKGCEWDGTRFTVPQGLRKGTYEWKNCEPVLVNDN